jgi:hypothetical protein
MKEVKKKPYIVPLIDVMVIQQYQNCLLESSKIPTPEIIDDEGDEGDEEELGW